MNDKKSAYKVTLPLAVVLFVGGCIAIIKWKDTNPLQLFGGFAVLASIPLFIISLISGIKATFNNKRKRNEETTIPAKTALEKPTPEQSQPTAISYSPPQEYHGSFLSYSYDDVHLEWDKENYEKIKSIPAGTVLSFKRMNDGQIDVFNGDMRLGGMHDNRLREMAFDFLKDPDRSAMTVLLSTAPIYLGMYFYSSGKSVIEKLRRKKDAIEYKLISNKNAEMQENIENCKAGDCVSIELDADKGKYLVCFGRSEIGYMPAGYKKFLEHHGDAEGRISEIIEPEDDSEKYEVFVIVIPKE